MKKKITLDNEIKIYLSEDSLLLTFLEEDIKERFEEWWETRGSVLFDEYVNDVEW